MTEQDYKALIRRLVNEIDVVYRLGQRLSERQMLAVLCASREHLNRQIAIVEADIDEQLRAEVGP